MWFHIIYILDSVGIYLHHFGHPQRSASLGLLRHTRTRQAHFEGLAALESPGVPWPLRYTERDITLW